MDSALCTRCGQTNPPGARYCATCGAPDPSAPAGQQSGPSTDRMSLVEVEALEASPEVPGLAVSTPAAVEALPAETGLLVVKRGPNAGSRFMLDTDHTTIGRHPDSTIFLDDVTVSRHHADIERHGHTFTLRDLGSLNGSYLNRDRVDKHTLTSGDGIRIGKFSLVFLASPHAS